MAQQVINDDDSGLVVRAGLNSMFSELYSTFYPTIVHVFQPSDLSGTLDSTKAYLITGDIDFTGTGVSIEVPVGD